MIDISIVIPVYNRGEEVGETLESCFEQRGVSVEILVVDDASSDGTLDFLKGYGERIRLIVLEDSHGNGTFARTVGLRAARGEFVKFLDHDDVLEPGTLAEEVAIGRRENADLVMSGWAVVDVDSEGKAGAEQRYEPPQVDRVVEAIFGEGKTPFTAAVLYRRALVADMEWDSVTALYDDFDWFSRAAVRATRIARRGGLAYWWRRNANSYQAAVAADPLSYVHAEKTRCLVYRKVEDALRGSGQLGPERVELLLRRFYLGLRAFARWDPEFCREILGRMRGLDPHWVPSPACEPSRAMRAAIRILGLGLFLKAYAAIRSVIKPAP